MNVSNSLSRRPAAATLQRVVRPVLLGLLVSSWSHGADTTRPLRVALMDTTTDGHDYPLMVAAGQFAELIFPRLAGSPGIEWVEREKLRLLEEELGIGLAASVDPLSAFRRGKWIKADVAILSRVTVREAGEQALELRAIDLDHAEALAELSLPAPAGLTGDSFVSQAAERLRDLLAEAGAVRDRRSRQRSLAVLFFHNRFAPPLGADLDLVERSFEQALKRAAERDGNMHVVRFAQAGPASEEAELVLAGLVEADPSAWEGVADLYVWGGFGPERTEPRVRVAKPASAAFTLNYWNGRGLMETERYVVTDLQDSARIMEVLESLTRAAVERARRPSAAGPSAESRRQVSNDLSQEARSLLGDEPAAQRSFAGERMASKRFSGWPAERRRFGRYLRVVEAVCFLDPGNQAAHEAVIQARWPERGTYQPARVESEFWTHRGRARAWGRYVDKFGLQPAAYANAGLLHPEVAGAYLDSLAAVLEVFKYADKTAIHKFPARMPESVESEWKQRLDEEMVARLKRVAGFINSGEFAPPEPRQMYAVSRLLGSVLRNCLNEESDMPPATRVQIIESVWPACATNANRLGRQWVMMDQDEARLAECFAEAGKPGGEIPLLAMITNRSSARISPRPAPSATAPRAFAPGGPPARPAAVLFDFPAFEVAQPARELPMTSIRFPHSSGVQRIVSLTLHGGRLWIVAEQQEEGGAIELGSTVSRETRVDSLRLWSVDSTSDQAARAAGGIGTNRVAAVWPDGDRLWLAGAGAMLWDPKTGDVRRFTLSDGLALNDADAIARVGDRVYVFGGSFQLFVGEPETGRWRPFDSRPTGPMRKGTGATIMFANGGDWLCLLAGKPHWYHLTEGRWFSPYESSNDVMGLAMNRQACWFGGWDSLYRLDLATRRLQHWPSAGADSGAALSPFGNLQTMDPQTRARFEQSVKARVFSQLMRALVPIVQPPDPFPPPEFRVRPASRLIGGVSAVALDGENLWVSTSPIGRNRHSRNLLRFHVPSHRWAGRFSLPNDVTCLAASDRHVWLGFSGSDPDRVLFRADKRALLNVPTSDWLPEEVAEKEFTAQLAQRSARQQAIYAFFTRDWPTATRLLTADDPAPADTEALILLGFCHAPGALNRPGLARRYFTRLAAGEAGTPLAEEVAKVLRRLP